MTYRELDYKATRLLDNGKITLGEYEEMTKPLDREVEQEPRKGHWIDGRCSECGCDVPAYIVDWKWKKDMDAKFCPNCGAKMESEG